MKHRKNYNATSLIWLSRTQAFTWSRRRSVTPRAGQVPSADCRSPLSAGYYVSNNPARWTLQHTVS
ncbi:hypothetical protein J6590_024771 [Homalodisca vitripennis]|nr:hypothetical protein J6590_024771 [Homalodisca vitripennis]